MSDWIRKMLAGKGMNRREFMRGTMGTAAAAAANKAPLPTGRPAAEAAKSLTRADILPPAFRSGFELPGGMYIVGRDGKAMVWGEGDVHFLSKDELAALQDAAKQAAETLQGMPSGGPPVYYNTLTKQWHPMVTLPEGAAGGGLRRVEYGKAGVDVPEGNWPHDAEYFDEDFLPMAQQEGTLTTPGADYLDNAGRRAGVNQIDGIANEWEQGQRALAEHYRQHPPQDADARRAHRQVLDNLGHRPGGWHNIGGNPLESDRPGAFTTGAIPMQEPPPARSATTSNNIRKLLGIAAPAAISAAAQGPVTREVVQ